MLLMCLASGSGASAENREGPMLVEFADSAAPGWHTVNDNVMGGRSRGAFDVGDGVLVFSGVTNTDGGGFASIRSGQVVLNLSGHQGIRLRLRGDGRRYTFRLTTSTARHRGRPLPYQADFETLGGAGWQLVDIPFAEFRPRWRGRSVAAPALDPSRIESLGIQIYDKRDGPFRLEIDWIQAHLGRAAFSMDRYHGAHRPLLVFTPSTDDPRLARQLADLTSSRREFEDRDMVLVTVAGAGLSEAGGLGLATSEARALRERYGVPVDRFAVKLVGKDGGVKRSDDSVVDMRAIYGLIDTMPMRQREMRRR